jgi:hypothetical protein
MIKRERDKMNNSKLKKLVFAGVSAVLAIASGLMFSGCLATELPELTTMEQSGTNVIQNTISVTGEGRVKVLPDEGFIDLAVIVEKPTTQEAVDVNSKITQDVVSAVEKIDAENLKIQTISYDLSPLYDYSQENQPPKIYAYRATTVIEARTTDLEKIGEIISTATEAGASSISSIGFDLSEFAKQDAKNNALTQATRDAESKAQAIADAMILKIDKIIFISEGATSFPGPVYASSGEMKAEDQVMSPIIYPQEIEVSSSVNITYYFSK